MLAVVILIELFFKCWFDLDENTGLVPSRKRPHAYVVSWRYRAPCTCSVLTTRGPIHLSWRCRAPCICRVLAAQGLHAYVVAFVSLRRPGGERASGRVGPLCAPSFTTDRKSPQWLRKELWRRVASGGHSYVVPLTLAGGHSYVLPLTFATVLLQSVI